MSRAPAVCRAALVAGALIAFVVHAAAEDVPPGRIVELNQFLANVGARVYLPTKYDAAVPTPIICFERAYGIAESATFRTFTAIAEELGWIAVIVEADGAETIDRLIAASADRFNVHPTMRFCFSFWNVPPIALALGCKAKPTVAGGMALNSAIIGTVPRGKAIVWLTCGRGIGSDGPANLRDETVRNYVVLLARGWPVRLDMYDGTSEASAGVMHEGARWMMRAYLRTGGRLIATDRQPVLDFMASEQEKAERHRADKEFYKAYEIAEELRVVKGPLQEAFGALYADLAALPEVQAELKAREEFFACLKAAAAAFDRDSIGSMRQVVKRLEQFGRDRAASHFSLPANDVLGDLKDRLTRGEL